MYPFCKLVSIIADHIARFGPAATVFFDLPGRYWSGGVVSQDKGKIRAGAFRFDLKREIVDRLDTDRITILDVTVVKGAGVFACRLNEPCVDVRLANAPGRAVFAAAVLIEVFSQGPVAIAWLGPFLTIAPVTLLLRNHVRSPIRFASAVYGASILSGIFAYEALGLDNARSARLTGTVLPGICAASFAIAVFASGCHVLLAVTGITDGPTPRLSK